VVFIGEQGVWTRAILPVDDSLGMPDAEDISNLSDLVGTRSGHLCVTTMSRR
jgi:hypothetical protein